MTKVSDVLAKVLVVGLVTWLCIVSALGNHLATYAVDFLLWLLVAAAAMAVRR